MYRFHIRYSFPDGTVNDCYITADSVEDAFERHARMWRAWNTEIIFISGEVVK